MFKSAAVDLKSAKEIALMRRAGAVVAQALAALERRAEPGVSTLELDALAEKTLRGHGAIPAFLGYRGFPHTLCASINCEVVHGIPSKSRILQEGDILSMDIGCVIDGFFGDAAITVPIGRISEDAERLLRVTRSALDKAIEQMRPDRRLGDVSAAVQACAEGAGYSVVREFVGHGIGRALHEDPAVPNYGTADTGLRLRPGMVLAIEPMVNEGAADVKVLDDKWTAVTADGRLSAHFEHTIAVTENGPEILTLLS
ncbi:MAG: type I methionyl aminopeptidase [Elusimicrobiota bacterium]